VIVDFRHATQNLFPEVLVTRTSIDLQKTALSGKRVALRAEIVGIHHAGLLFLGKIAGER
jgi:hypothetical protein